MNTPDARGPDRAWLSITDERTLLAERPDIANPSSLARLFHSPLLQLIEHISSTYPETARTHLRKPIVVDRAPTFAERALVQVAAKRTRVGAAPSGPAERITPPTWQPLPASSDSLVNLGEIRERLSRLLTPDAAPEPRYARPRPIAAVLLDARGKVLAHAKNEGAPIRCRHAEMNLLRTLAKEGNDFPPDSLLVVSLKPCRMCAAFLVTATHSLRDLRVLYLEDDPGPLARSTALEVASAGRLEFLRERDGLSPREAQRVVRHPDYVRVVQRDAGSWSDDLTITELLRTFEGRTQDSRGT